MMMMMMMERRLAGAAAAKDNDKNAPILLSSSSSSEDEGGEGRVIQRRGEKEAAAPSPPMPTKKRNSKAGVEEEKKKKKKDRRSAEGDEEEAPKKKKRKKKNKNKEDGKHKKIDASCSFPMSRVWRLVRSEGAAATNTRTTPDAVFLINKASEMFLGKFAEDAYATAVQERKKSIAYKHLSSTVSSGKRYEFLSDFVPEKVRAEDALKAKALVET
ncbi:uncharacterized protein LOC103708393 isoform X1 [Phoenix dactylifera]|uniref:Uncharacterized protein LOC103699795 isoform X1 n=1 Tax=Phoenix dactylifera TaxID=42345 RepID=A0A8B8ZVF9_PHODC|nr:uncharacterized protein LOC103699795 isoform X1 [Phoenix dactylifera]XP_038975369.1 uncharacterized protein LOC103708393 isoform X1 [Phoenix dactylifera]